MSKQSLPTVSWQSVAAAWLHSTVSEAVSQAVVLTLAALLSLQRGAEPFTKVLPLPCATVAEMIWRDIDSKFGATTTAMNQMLETI